MHEKSELVKLISNIWLFSFNN